MLEVHPFGEFIPSNPKHFLLGSYTTKPTTGYEWFYANGRNYFWPMLEEVYGIPLDTKQRQQQLFVDLKMALADIIYSCRRAKGSNLDNNLVDITYNFEGVRKILQYPIEKVFFSSRFVESKFNALFKDEILERPQTQLIYLPSPSPRYAVMSRNEKIARYKVCLPKLV